MRLSRSAFEEAVREAVAAVPAELQPCLEGVVVEVESRPSAEVVADLELDDPTELLGLYMGTPLTERHVESPPMMPDRIVIYQQNLEQLCESRTELVEEIRLTVLHEIGHHFGLDEDRLDELGYG